MRNRIAVFVSLLIIVFNTTSESKNLQAIFSHGRFFSAKDGPFVETYLSVSGYSVNYLANKEGLFQATINVAVKVKNDSGILIYKDNYNLMSPAIKDTNQTTFNFIDQQRIPLPNGTYSLELSITDKNGNGKVFTIVDSIKIDFSPSVVNVSDLVMIDSYTKSATESKLTKSGYDLVPYVDNFYPKKNNSLKFYAEIYNVSKVLGNGTTYLLTYHIENYESKQILDNYSVAKKQNAEDVSVILSEFEIADLPSGNYNLVVELRDKTNKLIGFNESYFQRSNLEATISEAKIENIRVDNTFVSGMSNHDELMEDLACLRPICNAVETTWQDNQLKRAETKLMQQFFYDFWFRRNPIDPETEWKKYKKEVETAQGLYGNKFLKGYNSDRGRVFLQYGLANSVVKNDHEPDAYPYEIWQYYKIKNQTNRKFVFYNPEIVGEDYRLLHSDMPGEISNANWNMALYKRNSQSNNMDVEKRRQLFGNQSQDTFDNPK